MNKISPAGLALCIVTFFTNLNAWADIPAPRVSLKNILDEATGSAPLLKANELDTGSLRGSAQQAGLWDNPSLNFWAGTYSIAPDRGRAVNATLMQGIPLFGQKGLARQVGEKRADIAEIDAQINRRLLRNEIVRLSYVMSEADLRYRQISHRREDLQSISTFLRTRPFASPSQAVEKFLIENRLREIEDKFLRTTADRNKAWQDLNVFLNRPEILIPYISWEQLPEVPEVNSFLRKLSESSPELQRQTEVVNLAKLERSQAGTFRFPDVKIGAGVYKQNVVLDREKSYVGILELTLPLWNRGQGAIKASDLKIEAEDLRHNAKKRLIEAQFQKVWASLLESKQRIALYPDGLTATLETQMNRAVHNWKKGLVTVPLLLELENQAHDQALRYFEARREYIEFYMQLLTLVGEEFQPQEAN